MTKLIKVHDQILDFAGKYVQPLFLKDFFSRTGRSAETPSATCTFIHRKGQVYCVTCRHVVEEVESPRLNHEMSSGVLSLSLEHGEINLGTPRGGCFSSPVKNLYEDNVDISLARIPWGEWEMLKWDKKQLEYIDLDEFKKPNYSKLESCGAIGFPNKLKVDHNRVIKLNVVVIVAGTTRPINTSDTVFQLHSELPEPHSVGFSGISGGLVVGIVNRNKQVPIGIVFEGFPSGEEENEGSILGPRDIYLSCNLLTPDMFDRWLERTSLSG